MLNPSQATSPVKDAALSATSDLVKELHSQHPDITAVRKALESGANIDGNERCNTKGHPITIAASNDNLEEGLSIEMIQLLVSRGGAILVESSVGPTYPTSTLEHAVATGRLRVASALLSQMAKPTMARNLSTSIIGARRERADLLMPSVKGLLLNKSIKKWYRYASRMLAMLVTDGHLLATEPVGWAGLANRLAGKPSDWLSALLTQACETTKRETTQSAYRSRPLLGRYNLGGNLEDYSGSAARFQEQCRMILAQGVRPRWVPSAHAMYPAAFRGQTRALLLCAARLGVEEPEPLLLGKLPREMLLLLIEALAERTFWDASWEDEDCWRRNFWKPCSNLSGLELS